MASIAGLTLIAFVGGCGEQPSPAMCGWDFVLRFPGADLDGALRAFTQAFLLKARGRSGFSEAYPVGGLLAAAPSSEDPGVEEKHCVPLSATWDEPLQCILLSERGDYLWLQLVDHAWARAYGFRVYVVPRFFLGKIDPVFTSFLAIDPIFASDSDDGLWPAACETMRDALKSMGAVEYGTGRP